ncbi:MFS transporter [Candidatus Saccharibacteria bacterium]|nr:MFS transporter [Candidatus Saccharibacteria bacterium]
MDDKFRLRMERNIWLYAAYKMFTKRVFLPLTTIYASQVAGLTISQIGITTAIAAMASVLFDTASGFWADQHGRKRSAQIGAALTTLGTSCYVLSPNFTGILAASLITSVGFAFMSGAIDALIHDTLVTLGRAHDYAKVASRAQAVSLIANAMLVGTVPLLYPIDPKYPFIIGTVAYCVLFFISTLITEPPIHHNAELEEKRFLRTVHKLLNRKTVLFFTMAGFMFSVANGTSDLFNLGFISLGLDPRYIGFVFAGSSVFGAFIGFFIHQLKRLTFRQYATLNVGYNLLLFAAFGLTRSLPFAITALVINLGLWRYEKILYQHYMLEVYGTTRYKATLMSLYSNFGSIHDIWLAFCFTRLAQHVGVLSSLSYGVALLLIAWPVLLFSINQFSANAAASVRLKNQ